MKNNIQQQSYRTCSKCCGGNTKTSATKQVHLTTTIISCRQFLALTLHKLFKESARPSQLLKRKEVSTTLEWSIFSAVTNKLNQIDYMMV